MSPLASAQTFASARQTARVGVARGWETGLKLVGPVRQRARRAPFVVVVLSLLAAGLVGLILMSTVLQKQAFGIADLRQQASALDIERQTLDRDVNYLQSPAGLAERAMGAGMVPNASPVFLRLSDGVIIGQPVPALPGTNIGQGG